jgi:hypothetical protein
VVEAFDGCVVRDAALCRGPRGAELGTGSGESLGRLGQPRGMSGFGPRRGRVEHEQLTAEALDPMSGLGAGVIELAAAVRAGREREGADDNDEHHRDQHHRGHQHCGHRLDGTRRQRLRRA